MQNDAGFPREILGLFRDLLPRCQRPPCICAIDTQLHFEREGQPAVVEVPPLRLPQAKTQAMTGQGKEEVPAQAFKVAEHAGHRPG